LEDSREWGDCEESSWVNRERGERGKRRGVVKRADGKKRVLMGVCGAGRQKKNVCV
jgi:hypothetical protein